MSDIKPHMLQARVACGGTAMLTLLTATGARHEAWAICEHLMARQDYAGPVHWVIVDDGPEAHPQPDVKGHWDVSVIRPQPYWRPGQNTQARNLAAGLAVIPDSATVVVIEDGDWYSPEYLSAVAFWLQTHELVGEGWARYYHVGRRVWRDWGNSQHASLCSTAVRGGALARLREVVGEHPTSIDLELWRAFSGPRKLQNTGLCVGTKGLPGRGGIGAGHRMTGRRDRDLRTLRQWIGDDADLYRRFGQ
jgi:hypothetical protein